MTSHAEFVEQIRGIAGDTLLQDAPYPVVAPVTAEMAASLVRAARQNQYSVMVLGTGSSFPRDFAVLRENILALMTIRLSGMEAISPYAVRVLAGTPVAKIVRGGAAGERKTLGGLICDGRSPVTERLLRRLWSRFNAVEVVGAAGDVRRFSTARQSGGEDPGLADLLVGSRGRAGMVTAVEIATPLPILYEEPAGDRRGSFDTGASDAVISSRDVQSVLDPDGIFQWS